LNSPKLLSGLGFTIILRVYTSERLRQSVDLVAKIPTSEMLRTANDDDDRRPPDGLGVGWGSGGFGATRIVNPPLT